MGGARPLVSKATKSLGFGSGRTRWKSWLGHSSFLPCKEPQNVSGCVLNCLTGCRRTTGTCFVSQGTYGTWKKDVSCSLPSVGSERAKEKTQDGLMSLTAEGHMALATGTGGLPETFVGRFLDPRLEFSYTRELLCGPWLGKSLFPEEISR